MQSHAPTHTKKVIEKGGWVTSQEIQNTYEIEVISRMPTIINGVHESSYRSFATMNLMYEMLVRGDSKETVLMLVRHMGLNQTEENAG